MSFDDDFEPKLGKIRHGGSKTGRRYLQRVLQATNRSTIYASFYPPMTALMTYGAIAFLLQLSHGTLGDLHDLARRGTDVFEF